MDRDRVLDTPVLQCQSLSDVAAEVDALPLLVVGIDPAGLGVEAAAPVQASDARLHQLTSSRSSRSPTTRPASRCSSANARAAAAWPGRSRLISATPRSAS